MINTFYKFYDFQNHREFVITYRRSARCLVFCTSTPVDVRARLGESGAKLRLARVNSKGRMRTRERKEENVRLNFEVRWHRPAALRARPPCRALPRRGESTRASLSYTHDVFFFFFTSLFTFSRVFFFENSK